MNAKFLSALVLALSAAACNQKPKTEPEATRVVPPQTVAPAAPTEIVNANILPAPDPLEQIPVQEDFEDRARNTITAENLDKEIESLERETAE
jgi:hypothetical protein